MTTNPFRPVFPRDAQRGRYAPTSRRRSRRALAAAGAVIAVMAGGLSLFPGVAKADSTTTLYIVGTSDVSDSGLIVTGQDPSPLVAGFQQAYPQYTLAYTGSATGTAISNAESGTAAGLIVHAESLETGFVDPPNHTSYSYNSQPGFALFYGDFVLLGPTGDPANILANDPHDIVDAFKDIAVAGAAGKADFVSRANTSGTTVEEHQIWSYLQSSGTSTVPGLDLCAVSTANGGGYAPQTTTGSCPSTPSYPSWYQHTGLTQAPNIEAANSCNFTNAQNNGANDCYVFTDRGTYDLLSHEGVIPNLKIVTRDNSASALGGSTVLTNYFHGYVVNPAAVPANNDTNVTGAQDFFNYVTSPAGQAVVTSYLNGVDTTPPFIGDAAPAVSVSTPPAKSVTVGKSITVKGSLTNVAPATPALAGETVNLISAGQGSIATVATTKTDSTGAFTLTYAPTGTAKYEIQVPQITQIENSTLGFSDILQATTDNLGTVTVVAKPTITSAAIKKGTLTVKGAVAPKPDFADGVVALRVKKPRASGFALAEQEPVQVGKGSYSLSTSLSKTGRYAYKVSLSISGQASSGVTSVHHITLH